MRGMDLLLGRLEGEKEKRTLRAMSSQVSDRDYLLRRATFTPMKMNTSRNIPPMAIMTMLSSNPGGGGGGGGSVGVVGSVVVGAVESAATVYESSPEIASLPTESVATILYVTKLPPACAGMTPV